MPLDFPENFTVVSTIEIAVVLKPDGDMSTEFGFEGLSKEAVVGYLQVVSDRIRDERRYEWNTCPECGEPWDAHDGQDDEDDDEEDEDEL